MASNREQEIEKAFSLVEGVLTDINVAMGAENLLQKIDQRYRGKAVVAGVGAAASDMFGQVAAAASVAMYDGEDTQNFMCLIDGQVMCGQFGGAQWLKEGNRVKAVVTQEDGVLVARGILDEKQGLLWVGHAWGSKAEALANWKIAFWCFVFGMTGMGVLGATLGAGSWTWSEMMLNIGFGGGVILMAVSLWTGRDMKGLSDPSTQVFKLFGFDDPAGVNLNRYGIKSVAYDDHLRSIKNKDKEINSPPALDFAEFQHRNTFNYKRAIEEGKLKLVAEGQSQAVAAQ